MMQKNENLVEDIMNICDELGLDSDAKMVESQNTFLSAWHKRSSVVSA